MLFVFNAVADTHVKLSGRFTSLESGSHGGFRDLFSLGCVVLGHWERLMPVPWKDDCDVFELGS